MIKIVNLTDLQAVLLNDLLSFTGGTMKDEKEILDIAHRTAWKYKFSNDPHHSDTYTFNKMCMIDFARKVSERGAPCLNFCEAQAFKIEIRQLKAACKKALEAMQWDVGGEPIPTLEIDAIAELKRVLAE